jgi:hypothetical protein
MLYKLGFLSYRDGIILTELARRDWENLLTDTYKFCLYNDTMRDFEHGRLSRQDETIRNQAQKMMTLQIPIPEHVSEAAVKEVIAFALYKAEIITTETGTKLTGKNNLEFMDAYLDDLYKKPALSSSLHSNGKAIKEDDV